MRGVWIEIMNYAAVLAAAASLPMRGVWIEIIAGDNRYCIGSVTPHAGSVD